MSGLLPSSGGVSDSHPTGGGLGWETSAQHKLSGHPQRQDRGALGRWGDVNWPGILPKAWSLGGSAGTRWGVQQRRAHQPWLPLCPLSQGECPWLLGRRQLPGLGPRSGPSCCCQQSWERPLGGGRLGSGQYPSPSRLTGPSPQQPRVCGWRVSPLRDPGPVCAGRGGAAGEGGSLRRSRSQVAGAGQCGRGQLRGWAQWELRAQGPGRDHVAVGPASGGF